MTAVNNLPLTPDETEDDAEDLGTVVTSNGSLRDRLAARRVELQRARTFTLPIPLYEDLGLHARYRILTYEAMRKIGEGVADMADAEQEVASAKDTLVRACVELLEKRDGDFVSLGLRWGTRAAREIFGADDLPEDATARQAMDAVFAGESGHTQLMLHFAAYDEQLTKTVPKVHEAMRGESAADSAED